MKNEFNIKGNTFNDHSGVFNINDIRNPNFDIDKLYLELKELNENLNPKSSLYKAICDLQESMIDNDTRLIGETVKRNAVEFGKSFFISIASSTLSQYIKQFLT